MEKLVAAIILLENVLRRDGYYSGDYATEDITSDVDDSWLRVLAAMEELGYDVDEQVAGCVDHRKWISSRTTERLTTLVNRYLRRRTILQRLFGPQEIPEHLVTSIRRDLNDIIGPYT